jgi:hypothetical protein
MANRYWVGGTASWDSTAGTKWSATSGGAGGASVPTSVDDVFFDANSGSPNVSISVGNTGCASINCTGYTGNLGGTGALTISGSMTLSSAMTFTYGGALSFNGAASLDTAGKSITGNIIVNNTTLTLSSNVTSSSLLELNSSTFAMGSHSPTFSRFNLFGSSSITSSLAFPIITLTGFNLLMFNWTSNTATCAAGLTFNLSYSGVIGTRQLRASFPLVNIPRIRVSNGNDTVRFTTATTAVGELDFTGAFAGVFQDTTIDLPMYGSLTLNSAMTFSHTSSRIIFRGPANITSAGQTTTSITIQSGAGVIFVDNFQASNAKDITLEGGSLTALGNVTVGRFSAISPGSQVRSLTMGFGIWTLTGIGVSVWNSSISTNFTLNPQTAIIDATGSGTRIFAGGGKVYYALNNGNSDALVISGSNTFTFGLLNSVYPTIFRFEQTSTQTIGGFGINGAPGNLATIESSSAGNQFTLSQSSGTVNAMYLSIKDSNATGGATWDALSPTNTNLGNNTGWLFPSSGAFMQFF